MALIVVAAVDVAASVTTFSRVFRVSERVQRDDDVTVAMVMILSVSKEMTFTTAQPDLARQVWSRTIWQPEADMFVNNSYMQANM